MTLNATQFWPWSVQMFGSVGAVVVLLLPIVIVICMILTLVYVWRINYRISHIEHTFADLLATQNRQEQVERIQRATDRKKPRRRR